jgi:hypothetical protein
MTAGQKLVLGATAALLLAACGGPIVARSPQALYALAKEQIVNANYTPAVDTLARISREAPGSDMAGRAQVLQIALLAGMARSLQEIGESYLAGSREAGAAAYAPQMRSIAMDYFGRSRSRAIEMVEALDRLMQRPLGSSLRVDMTAGTTPQGGPGVLVKVRQGTWVESEEMLPVENALIQREFGEMLNQLSGGGAPEPGAASEVALDPAALYLAGAQEIVSLTDSLRAEALNDPRMARVFYERAARAAGRAAELAQQEGKQEMARQSQELLARCQNALKKQ